MRWKIKLCITEKEREKNEETRGGIGCSKLHVSLTHLKIHDILDRQVTMLPSRPDLITNAACSHAGQQPQPPSWCSYNLPPPLSFLVPTASIIVCLFKIESHCEALLSMFVKGKLREGRLSFSRLAPSRYTPCAHISRIISLWGWYLAHTSLV